MPTIQCMYIDILISSLSLMNDETNKGGEKKVREETEGFQGGKEIKKKEEKKEKGIERRSYKNFLEE